MTVRDAYPDNPTRGPLGIGTARDGRDLGRVVDAGAAVAEYGESRMSPIFDGFLEYDHLGQSVMTDFMGGRGTQRMLRQALDGGIESVEDPPASLTDLFAEIDHVPDWVDWEQLRRGAVAYWRPGPLVSFAFTSGATAGGDRGIGGTRPQTFTGRFEEKGYTRAAETFRWLLAATTPDGMHRTSDGFKLSIRVRILHAAVRHTCAEADDWLWDEWGTPISATDQAQAIANVFTTVMVDSFAKLGVRYSAQERQDIYALWRYIGHVMGVPAHQLMRDEAHAREYGDIWWSMDPGPDEFCRRLVESLIEMSTPEVPVPDQPIDVFPPLALRLLPPLRLRAFLYGLIRFLHGDAIGDSLAIPDTRWKHVGHAIRPGMLLVEALRRIGLIDDERVGHKTRALFERALGARPGEPVVAPPDEVAESVRSRRFRPRAR